MTATNDDDDDDDEGVQYDVITDVHNITNQYLTPRTGPLIIELHGVPIVRGLYGLKYDGWDVDLKTDRVIIVGMDSWVMDRSRDIIGPSGHTWWMIRDTHNRPVGEPLVRVNQDWRH